MNDYSPASGYFCLAAIAAALLGISACAPPPKNDPDAGVPPGGPQSIDVDPAFGMYNIPIDKIIRVTFSDHLDSRQFDQSMFDLYSGSLSLWVMSFYDPVRRQLVAWPSKSMRKRMAWVLAINEGLVGIDGEPVAPAVLTRFRTGDLATEESPYAVQSFSDDILPIFERSCASCHGGRSTDALAGLRLDSIQAIHETAVGRESQGWPGWDLIAPSSPGGSYLLYKIIGDKRIAGMRMPRTLDLNESSSPLPLAEQKALSDWIASGVTFY